MEKLQVSLSDDELLHLMADQDGPQNRDEYLREMKQAEAGARYCQELISAKVEKPKESEILKLKKIEKTIKMAREQSVVRQRKIQDQLIVQNARVKVSKIMSKQFGARIMSVPKKDSPDLSRTQATSEINRNFESTKNLRPAASQLIILPKIGTQSHMTLETTSLEGGPQFEKEVPYSETIDQKHPRMIKPTRSKVQRDVLYDYFTQDLIESDKEGGTERRESERHTLQETKFISNISSKLKTIQKLLHNDVEDIQQMFGKSRQRPNLNRPDAARTDRNQSEYNNLPRKSTIPESTASDFPYSNSALGRKVSVANIESIKQIRAQAQSELRTLSPSHSNILPKIIKEQLQDDYLYKKLFGKAPVQEMRSNSVLNLKPPAQHVQFVNKNKSPWVAHNNVINQMRNPSYEDPYRQQQPRQHRLPFNKKTQKKEQEKSAFPLQTIEIRKIRDADQEKQKFDSKFEQIIGEPNDNATVFSFSKDPSDLVFKEKELQMRAKLYKFDRIIDMLFQDSFSFQSSLQAVKVKDVAKLPTKKSKSPQKTNFDTDEPQKYGRQLQKVSNMEYENSLFFKQLKSGKKQLVDHQGIVLSPGGTRMDELAQTAITEEELNRLFKKRKEKQDRLDQQLNQPLADIAVSEDYQNDDDPYTQLRKYFKNKKQSAEVNQKLSLENLMDYDLVRLEQIANLHAERQLKNVGIVKKPKTLPAEILGLIKQIKVKFAKESEKKMSKKLYRMFLKYILALREQLDENYNTVGLHDVIKNVEFAMGFSNVNIRRVLHINQNNGQQEQASEKSILGDPEDEKSNGHSANYEAESDERSSTISQSLELGSDIAGSQDGDVTIDNFKEKLQLFKGRDRHQRKKDRVNPDKGLMDAFVQTVEKTAKKTLIQLSQENLNELQKKKKKEFNRDEHLQFLFDQKLHEQEQQQNHEDELKKHIQDRLFGVIRQKTKQANYNKEKLEKEKARYMMRKMANDVKQQDQHQQYYKQVLKNVQQSKIQKIGNKQERQLREIEPDQKTDSGEASDTNSLINGGREKREVKTKQQVAAELNAFEAFILECDKQNIVTSSILKSLARKKLVFTNQKVSNSLLEALVAFISSGMQGGEAFHSIALSQNNFQDSQYTKIVKAIAMAGEKTKSFVSVQNPLSVTTLQYLVMIVSRPPIMINGEIHYPRNKHLVELNINESLPLSSGHFGDLTEALSRSCTGTLRRLGLSYQLFDGRAATGLLEFIQGSKRLKKLDLSNTKFTNFSSLVELIEGMASENQSIQFLNISGIPCPAAPPPQLDPVSIRTRYIQALVFLIKNSMTLVHLNLSACFPALQADPNPQKCRLSLPNPMTFQAPPDNPNKPKPLPICAISCLFEAISRSKTLQSIHFSGNMISPFTLKVIKQILKINSKVDSSSNSDYQDIIDKVNHLSQKQDSKKVPKLMKKQVIQKAKRQADLRTDLDVSKTALVQEKDRLSLDYSPTEKNIMYDDRLVIQRVLGHQEIRDGHKWKIRDSCWICAGWSYALIIWSPILAGSGPLFETDPVLSLQKWEDKLLVQNGFQSPAEIYDIQTSKKINGISDPNNCPRIVGQITDFEFKSMVPMPTFINLVMDNQRPWLRLYQVLEEEQRMKDHAEKIKTHVIDGDAISQSNLEWVNLLKDYLKYGYKQTYLSLTKMKKYGVEPTEMYFCFADYVPPQHQIELTVQCHDMSDVSVCHSKYNPRPCDAQMLVKRIKKQSIERKFDLQYSQFQSWKVDLKRHYEKCLTADMQYSKIYKFVKEKSEMEAVKRVLLDYFEIIYEQYVYGQGSSNFPTVGWLDFSELCNQWKIISKTLTSQDIDRLFVAVNFEEVQGQNLDLEDNPDKELCRYEFFEIIVRMARTKFIEKGKLNVSISEATKMLLDEFICKASTKQKWHELRRGEIWTLDVHDVLEANQYMIKNFIKWWIANVSKKQGRKMIYLDEIVNRSAKGSEIKPMVDQIPRGYDRTIKEECGMNDDLFTLCYANSKFIIIDEMIDIEKLSQIKYDEFLEFISRVAVCAKFETVGGWTTPPEEEEPEPNSENDDEDLELQKETKGFQGQQQSIQDKVFKVIDLFVKLCRDPKLNLHAIRPQIQGLGDSESDYDDF